ncbi:MAG: 5-bromo-4-chloroindolyl phosphate hydrolysis family protein [Paracoccaceae bacterium]
MAERFGGRFSPEQKPASPTPPKGPFEGKTRSKAGGRVNFLFLAPLPLAVTAFFQDSVGLAARLIAFGLLILAAWLTREGIIAQEAYEARKIARRPAMPRKIVASILTGIGLAIPAAAEGEVVSAAIFGILGAALHSFAFGLDPLKNKGMEGVDEFQTDRVARAVEGAEKYLSAMSDAILRAKDRDLERRVESFQATARAMFRTIENDPRDLTAARKYLSVYLMGARDATVKFADIYARSRDAGARADYIALLDDLEANFTGKTQKLLIEDRSDLTVEIDVLRERLAREGVPVDRI